MSTQEERTHWLAYRDALGKAMVAKDLVEIDYEYDVPDDLGTDTQKLIDAIDNAIEALRNLKEDLR